MRGKKLLALCASAFFLSACGGGGGGGGSSPTPAPPATSTGVFVDSVVAGLHYSTATKSGETNSAGEYDYLPGETVTFSIGGIVLGSALAGPVVTPLTLVSGATDETDPVVTNIVRLLLTLDDDGIPGNGITISPATAAAAVGQTVNFNAPDLSTDPGMVALLPLLPGTPPLVDATTAQTHFAATLTSTWGSMTWGTGTWMASTP
jgi:hypothetical protein